MTEFMFASGKNDPKEMAPPTKEEIAKCRKEVYRALSGAVKSLFDDENHGGDFFAHYLMSFDRKFDDPRVPTAAVSFSYNNKEGGKLNLYINSYFFVKHLAEGFDLTKESDKKAVQLKRAMVIKHEILHVTFFHLTRGKDFGNQTLANIAADLVVNSCIDKSVMGDGFLYPENFNLPKDKAFDWYYTNYPIEDHPICDHPHEHDKQYQQSQGNSQPDQNDQKNGDGKQKGEGEGGEGDGDEQQGGSGGGSSSVDGQGKCKVCGGYRPFDNHNIWNGDGAEHMSDTMKESLVKDALIRAADATKKAGRLPQSIQDMIAMARKKPQVPWQRILRQFVSRIANGSLKTTKKRPSKRFKCIPGTKVRPKLKLAIPIDVSGSISNEEYTMFLNEIFAIARAVGGEVEVIEWDTQVQGTYKIKGYKPNITRHGSGGTDPREAVKYVNDRRNKIDGCLFFTDGHLFGELTEKLRVPSLWVVTADGSTDCLKDYRKIKLPKTTA